MRILNAIHGRLKRMAYRLLLPAVRSCRGWNGGKVASLAFFVGALIPTGLLAALFVWMPGRVIGRRVVRVLVANGLALALPAVVGGYAIAGGGLQIFDPGFLSYLLPQGLWTVAWLVILKRRENSAAF